MAKDPKESNCNCMKGNSKCQILSVNEDIDLFLLVGESVATLLWPSVGVKPNIWKKWDLESSGTPECSELNSKGQNTFH